MDGLHCKDGNFCTAPLCLLYVDSADRLVPIAIQLYKVPSKTNPVFLPSDNWIDWIMAKTYFFSALAQVICFHFKEENISQTKFIYKIYKSNVRSHHNLLRKYTYDYKYCQFAKFQVYYISHSHNLALYRQLPLFRSRKDLYYLFDITESRYKGSYLNYLVLGENIHFDIGGYFIISNSDITK